MVIMSIEDFKRERQKLKIMKLFEGVRELMDYFDDGHHNKEYCELVKISNQLIEDYEKMDQV
jgi:hypothetical protein